VSSSSRNDGADVDAADLFERLPDPGAKDQLVRMFLPLAENIARRFVGRGESLDDLIQVASLGLVQAIDRFDRERGVRFSTFATVTIVGELKRHFRDHGWSIRVPRNLQESTLVVNRAVGELWQELGRSPTAEDVARRIHLSVDEVLESMEAASAYSTTSLEAPIDSEGLTVGDTLGDADPAFDISEKWVAIEPAIRRLPPREQRILLLRFFKGMTQAEIAEQIGISQMHVSRLLIRTLRWLREAGKDGEGEPGLSGPGSPAASAEDADAAGADQ
jgi:RNA polymerase sigma-B factor